MAVVVVIAELETLNCFFDNLYKNEEIVAKSFKNLSDSLDIVGENLENILENKLSTLNWHEILPQNRVYLKEFLCSLVMYFPSFGLDALTCLLKSITIYNTNNLSEVIMERLFTVKEIVEALSCVRKRFEDFFNNSSWNYYKSRDVLSVYILNFVYLGDLLSFKYRYELYKIIFDHLLIIDGFVEKEYFFSKFQFMKRIRENNIDFDLVLKTQGDKIKDSDKEQLEFFDKLDVLFKLVLELSTVRLKKSNPDSKEYFKLFIKLFDNIMNNSASSTMIQFIWFHLCNVNKKFMMLLLMHIMKKIRNRETVCVFKLQYYIFLLGGLVALSKKNSNNIRKKFILELFAECKDSVSPAGFQRKRMRDDNYKNMSEATFVNCFHNILYIIVNTKVDEDFNNFLKTIDFKFLINHQSNPLVYIPSRLTIEFINLMKESCKIDLSELYKGTKTKNDVCYYDLSFDVDRLFFGNELYRERFLINYYPFKYMLLPLSIDTLGETLNNL